MRHIVSHFPAMRTQIASGAGWMLLFKLIDRVLAVVSTAILARLLVPEDFGLVAMAMSVLAIIELATLFSFDIALIQRRELQRVHYDTAWTLGLILAAAGSATVALLAYPAAVFYKEPRLTAVVLILAGGWMLGALENVGLVDFRRHLEFRREFAFLITRRIFAFLLTTILAFSLGTYWALVIGSVAGKLAGVLLSYAMHSYRPRISLAASRQLFDFSGWMLATNLVGVVQARAPHFIVGRVLGAPSLGVLTIAADIAQIASSDLMASINRAVLPGYSRMADDLVLLRSVLLDVVAVLSLVALPVAGGIAAVAQPLVRTMLGEAWIDAIPVMQVLAVASGATALASNFGYAYMALGLPKQLTLIQAWRLLLTIPFALILVPSIGVIGAAFAELAASVVFLVTIVFPLLNRLEITFGQYLARSWRPIAATAVMAAVVLLVVDHLPQEDTRQSALALATGVATGLVVYPMTILTLWLLSGRPEGAEAIIRRRLRAAFSKRAVHLR